MRTYLAPLGFDSRRVVRPVLGEGLDPDDEVILLQPANSSERGEEAYEDVEEVLTQVAPDLDLKTELLPYTDFVETVLYCVDLIQAANGETVVILGGGARELLLPLTVATFSSNEHVDTILQVGDIDSSVRRLPQLNLRGGVSDASAVILSSINGLDTPLSISETSDRLEKSKSTIARHVKTLEEVGFIETRKEGRTKKVTVTDSGRIFLETREPDLLQDI